MFKRILLGCLALGCALGLVAADLPPPDALPTLLPKPIVNVVGPSKAVPAVAPAVNINTASAEAMSHALTGIGPAKAKAIVEHRQKRGAFQSIDELLEVKGIGPATLAKNRTRLRIVD